MTWMKPIETVVVLDARAENVIMSVATEAAQLPQS